MKKIILSDNKQNQLVDDITDAFLQRHTFQDGAIKGSEIAGFCPHKQVGNFILFRIYQDWNAHMQHFVHPYFDFNNPAVRDGLRRFQNTVSQHIRIEEADFRKLVRSAVYNNLKLILNPEETIVNFFFSSAQVIPAEIYAKHAPYFNDFDFAIKSILRYLEKNGIEKVERSLFLAKFEKVIELFEKRENKSIGQYQRYLFLRLTGKEMEDVVGVSAPVADSKKEEAKKEAEENEKEEERLLAEEARKQAEMDKREEQRMASRLRREEEARKAAEEARRKVEADKEAAALKAEEDRKAAEEIKNKPVIRVTPKPRVEPENNPPPEDKGPTLPPWVDPPKEEPKKEEEKAKPEEKKAVSNPEAPKTVPPWVDTTRRNPEPNPEVKVVSSPPTAKEALEKEAPQTVSDALQEKKKDEPRSLNDMYSNREKPTTLLDRSREEQETQPEKRVADIAAPKTPEVEKTTPPAKIEQKEEPIREEPVAKKVEEVTPPKEEAKEPENVSSRTPEKTEEKETPKVESTEEETPSDDVNEEKANPPVISLWADREEKKVESEKSPDAPRTLADSFQEKKETQGNVNQSHSGKAIKTEQIPVHKQFQFVQRVFGGSSVKFKVVLDKINKTNSMEEAIQVLDKYVYNDPTVNRTDKVAKEFEQLVRARFE